MMKRTGWTHDSAIEKDEVAMPKTLFEAIGSLSLSLLQPLAQCEVRRR
jgi:hypothetical protein